MSFHSRDKENKDTSSLGKPSQVKVGRIQASRDHGGQCKGSKGRDNKDNRDRDNRDSRDRDRQLHLPGHSCIVGTRKVVSRERRHVGLSTSRWVFIR